MAHTASSKVILDNFFAKLEDVAVIEKPAKLEGRSMIMFLTEKR
jgi:translation initiation factor IF-3